MTTNNAEALRALEIVERLTAGGAAGAIATIRAALASQPQAATKCVICGEDEPYTGTCGSNDPRALCKQPQADGGGGGARD
jgi:hypothetical protein